MLKIRLRRDGTHKSPFYRIVVSDSLRTPGAANVEQIGYYNPTKEPNELRIEKDRVEYWISKGAQLSSTVRSILKRAT